MQARSFGRWKVSTLIVVEEKARVAVSSLCCASSKAAWFNAATVRTSTGLAAANATAPRMRGSEENILEMKV